MMRLRFLAWFLFISCTQAISSSDLHRNFSSEQRGLNSSESNMLTQQPVEKYGSIKEALRLHRKDEEKYELSYDFRKAQGGKGASGGANVNHHPRHSGKSATAPLLSSISTVSVCLAFVSVFSFLWR